MILWAVRFLATSYVLRVQISGTTTNLPFPVSGSLTLLRDYFMSEDARADGVTSKNNGHGDLIRMLQLCIRGHVNGAAATVAFDANFKLIVTFGGGQSGQLLWANAATTLDEAIFGFANVDTTNAVSTTGGNVPQGVFRPRKPIADDSRDRQGIVGGIGRTMSGKVRGSFFGLPTKDRRIFFAHLNKNVVLTEYLEADNPTGSLEYAWINSIARARYFRLYTDESLRTQTSYRLYQTTKAADELERNEQFKIWWNRGMSFALAEVPT